MKRRPPCLKEISSKLGDCRIEWINPAVDIVCDQKRYAILRYRLRNNKANIMVGSTKLYSIVRERPRIILVSYDCRDMMVTDYREFLKAFITGRLGNMEARVKVVERGIIKTLPLPVSRQLVEDLKMYELRYGWSWVETFYYLLRNKI